MRAGVIVSAIGHVGAVMMTFLAWEARPVEIPSIGSVVPVEIVDIAAESNVRALAIPAPDEEEVSPDETEPAAQQEQVAANEQPSARPQPRNSAVEELERAMREIGLANKENEPRPRRVEGDRLDRNQEGAGLGTAEVAALEDRVRALARAHLLRCWRMPIDLPEPDRLVVNVEFDLDRNGRLRGQPRVTDAPTFDPAMRQARETALRAVRQCDPFPFPDDPAVGEHYQVWSRMEFTFRPRL